VLVHTKRSIIPWDEHPHVSDTLVTFVLTQIRTLSFKPYDIPEHHSGGYHDRCEVDRTQSRY